MIYDKVTWRSRGAASEVKAAAQQFNGYVRRYISLLICSMPIRVLLDEWRTLNFMGGFSKSRSLSLLFLILVALKWFSHLSWCLWIILILSYQVRNVLICILFLTSYCIERFRLLPKPPIKFKAFHSKSLDLIVSSIIKLNLTFVDIIGAVRDINITFNDQTCTTQHIMINRCDDWFIIGMCLHNLYSKSNMKLHLVADLQLFL